MIDNAVGAAPRLVWTVAGLIQAVADALAARFSACTVRGELSSFMRAASGHCYFSLKDAEGGAALIRCAMFRRAALQLSFAPRDGQLVELRGRLAVYEPRGELQFVVEAMRPAGAGALYEQFLQLKARLESEGLFDAARKRPIPLYPRAVGVITSLGAAALHDVLTALQRRAPNVHVVVYPGLVQGTDAPAALVAALALAGQRAEVDTLLLCRGGGSLEDLWAFNDERVVRAVAASSLPLICGVGHETDVSLADFAADLRAPTPTAAAELAAPPTRDSLQTLAVLQARMARRTRQVLDQQAQRLDSAMLRLSRPMNLVRRHAQTLALLEQRLNAAPRHALLDARRRLTQAAARLSHAQGSQRSMNAHRLAALAARLDALNPQRVLARGFAWLSDTSGTPVQSVAALHAGDTVHATLADGRISAQVTRVEAAPPEA